MRLSGDTDLPFIDIIGIPWLILLVGGGHVSLGVALNSTSVIVSGGRE